MKYKLAIIGASYLQLPLVLKAREHAIETHCFAWEEGAVCKEFADFFYPISVTDKEKILEVCKQVQINGITTIATDLPGPTIAYVASKLGLVGNTFETAVNTTNKALMRNILKDAKIKIPGYQSISNVKEFLNNLNYPLIVKPVDSSGSRGVNKINSFSDFKSSFEAALQYSIVKKAIVEEFIEGDEVSVEGLSIDNKHSFLTITDKVTTGAPHFVELSHHQPSQLSQSIQAEILKTTKASLDALNISNGASHTELKIDKNGNVYVIEVGARMGGDFIGSHLVELSTGYDYMMAVINIALNINTVKDNEAKFCNYSGVYFLCKENEHLLPYFKIKNSFDVTKKILNSDLVNIKSSNDRSGYLIYKSIKKIKL
jgi:biotin carboxylase